MTEHSTDLPFFGGSFDVSMGSQLAWGVGFCVFWAVVIELWLKLNVPWLAKQPFWKGGAQNVQRKLLNNFGFPSEPTPPKFPEGLTESFVTESWSAALVYSFTHAVCVAPCMPVAVYGWEAVSAPWRTAFVLGALGDLGFTLYDELKTTWRALCWQSFQKMTGQAPVTMGFWVIMCVLHHPMSLCILFAMNANYVWLPAYHRIVYSLLLAAAICVGLGQYKMTLDIKTRGGLLQFKICVIIPFFVMLWARGYVWATEVYSALKTFHDAGDDAFFYGALPLSLLMTLFNVVLIVDVTQSFVKYVILGQRDGGVAKAAGASMH